MSASFSYVIVRGHIFNPSKKKKQGESILNHLKMK